MNDYGNPENQKKYGVVYDMYGIYIDWKIDNNIFAEWGVCDPLGIDKFEDFYALDCWQIAKINIARIEMLVLDVNLTHFSYDRMTKVNKTVLEDNIAGSEVAQRLADWQREIGLLPLNQLKLYRSIVRGDGNTVEFVYKSETGAINSLGSKRV